MSEIHEREAHATSSLILLTLGRLEAKTDGHGRAVEQLIQTLQSYLHSRHPAAGAVHPPGSILQGGLQEGLQEGLQGAHPAFQGGSGIDAQLSKTMRSFGLRAILWGLGRLGGVLLAYLLPLLLVAAAILWRWLGVLARWLLGSL